ncbi:hypothetical protein PoHVEF18_010584 [Penicillium ochrochloron]
MVTKRGAFIAPDFTAVLDADCMPAPDFLRATLPHLLRQPELAVVGAIQRHYNLPAGDPLYQGSEWFSYVVTPHLNRLGYSLAAGSGYVVRHSLLLAIGGFPTLTGGEDLMLSLALAYRGKRILILRELLQIGRIPPSLQGHVLQRRRWATAISEQILAWKECKENPLPRKARNVVGFQGILAILTFLNRTLAFCLVPLAVGLSQPLVPVTSRLSFKAHLLLATVFVSLELLSEYVQAARSGFRASMFPHLEEAWLAPGQLLAIFRFYFCPDKSLGSPVTGSVDHAWNKKIVEQLPRTRLDGALNTMQQSGVVINAIFFFSTITAMIQAGAACLQSYTDPVDRAITTVAWPPILLMSYQCITVLITLAKITYNIFLHPLRRYPGSKFHAATAFPLCWAELQGQAHLMIQKAHEKYGPVVRVSPGELSFMTAPSWTDIYASRQGKPSFPRDSTFFNEMLVDHRTLTMANDKDHARIRGSMAPAFAPRALMQQEPILQQNIDLLIKQLMKLTVDNQIVDLRTWYNYTTFDLLGDLAFGKSFGCLATSTFHEWVQFVLDLFYAAVLLRVVHRFRPLNRVLALLIPRSLMVKRERHSEMAILKVRERIRAQTERPDFIYYMLQAAGKETISPHELEQQASILILAGSETTSVALTYATYLLLQHEPVLRQLRQELRANFQTEADINLLRVNRLSFLHAVLQEVLRLYPPFSNGFPRQTPIQGAVVDGQFIPGNVGLYPYPPFSQHRA